MGWFNLFKSKWHPKRKSHKSNNPGLRNLVEKLQSDMAPLQSQIQSLQTTVNKHDVTLTEHTSLFEEHKVRVAKLEQLVAAQPPTSQPVENLRQISRPQAIRSSSQQKFDIDGFSPQQKRILQVFFEHPDMALSYNDLSQALGKSALTVKNQLHEIRLKADMFSKTVGEDNRNRFKLKDNLRLQKYLDLG
jgi:hypothetical protein